jgi:hypothetical protein
MMGSLGAVLEFVEKVQEQSLVGANRDSALRNVE